MPKTRKPPPWQKDSRVLEVTLPAHVTKSGKEEKIKLNVQWELRATKPWTARELTRWEMRCARNLLERASSAAGLSQDFTTLNTHDLGSALMHAVRAWCRTHLRGKATGDHENFRAFMDKAPDLLKQQVSDASAVLRGLNRGVATPAEAIALVRTAIEGLLDAATHPPRNRCRFPASLKSGRPPHKPRVRPGGWIDTGRYRPAQVLAVMDHPPHIMTLSYGDEVDDNFRPHISSWKTIRMRKRPPSLKEVFSPGDWMRHTRFGYGRVLTVRDSTIDVAFGDRTTTLVPDARLRKIEKVDEPAPEDNRPICERFPPGSWIEQDSIGKGVVIATTDDTLTVLLSDRIISIMAEIGPVVWKLDRPPLDLTLPRERRRLWAWQNSALCRSRRPCPCCGYPNLGKRDAALVEPVQCLVCGWTDEWDGEEDADEARPVPDPEDPLDWEWPNWGYSLTEARRNFERQSLMFRRGDRRAKPFAKVAALRLRLRWLLDEIMTDASKRHDNWPAIAQLRQTIIRALARKRLPR